MIESISGARLVHDTLEQAGWDGEIGRAEGEGPRAAGPQDDKIDSRVLAGLSERELVPAIWLPDARIPRGARAGPLSAPAGQAQGRRSRTGSTRR